MSASILTPRNNGISPDIWANVSKTHECQTCGKPDWCFYLVEDPEVYGCRRLGDVGSLTRTDKSGVAYYLHLPKGRQPKVKGSVDDLCKHVPSHADHGGEPAAPVDERHVAYAAFLGALALSEEHRAGLPMAPMLELIGYRTCPFELGNAAKPIRRLTGPSIKSYLRIPGTRIEESLKGDTLYTISQHKGYYIPVRNHRGQIEGLRVRKDDDSDGKYVYFRGEKGQGSSSPMRPHVAIAAYAPRYVDRDEGVHTVRLLEGEKKADLATLYTGVLSIGVPSVGSYGLALEGTLDEPGPLHALKVRRIILPFDADMRQNPAVASASTEAVLKLWEGFEVVGEFWPPEAGKGYDDVWANGRQDEITSLEGLDLLRKCAEFCKSAGVPENPKLAARIRLMEAQGKEDLVLTDDIADALLIMLGTTDGHRFSDEWAERAKETRQSTKLERLLKEAKKRAKEAKKKELVERQEEEAETTGKPLFELGDNAEVSDRLLADLAEASRPLVTDEGELWQYEPEERKWKVIIQEHLSKKVKKYSRSPIKGSQQKLRINATGPIIKLAMDEAMPDEGHGFFSRRPRGLAFANTFVRVEKDQLVFERHKPEHRVRHAYDIDYAPPEPNPEGEPEPFEFEDLLWEWLAQKPEMTEDEHERQASYLRGDTAQRVKYVQEFLGLSLLGLAPKYCGKALILLGDGANGKSALMSIIKGCFPPEAVTEVPPHDWTNDQKVALLAGKWLNVVGELPSKDYQESQKYKAIMTGDEAVLAKNVFERPFLVWGEAGQIFLANKMFASGDGSHGFVRRNAVLTMSQVYLDHQQDKLLVDRVLSNEKSRIIAWMLDGARDALRRGKIIGVPQSSDEAVAVWMEQSDPVRRWLVQECCGVTDFELMAKGTYIKRVESLYQDYRVWAQANGHQSINSATFAERLRQATMALARTPPEGFWVQGADSLDTVARTGERRHRTEGRRCPILTRAEWERIVSPPDEEERKAPVAEVDLNSLN